MQDEMKSKARLIEEIRQLRAERAALEHSRIEQVLLKSDVTCRYIIDASPVPCALNDEEQNIIYLNPAFINTFGYDIQDIPTLAQWWPRAYPDPAYRQQVASLWQEHLDKAREDGLPFAAIELDIRCKDGTVRTAIVGATPLTDDFKGMHLVTLFDITERKQVHDELLNKEMKLARAQSVAQMGFIDWDLETNAVELSDQLYPMFGLQPVAGGYTVDDIVSMVHPSDSAFVSEQLTAAVQGQKTYSIEHRIIRPDGAIIWVQAKGEMTRDANGDAVRLLGTVVDITERKVAQEKLSRIKAFTDTALDAQMDTLFIFEPATGKAVRWNKSFRDLVGYSDEEIASLPAPASYYSSDDMQRATVFLQQIMTRGEGTIELDLVCKSGRRIPTEYRVSLIADEEGNSSHLISIGRDITERKLAKERLLLTQFVSDHAPDCIAWVDEQARFCYVNEAECREHGYTKEELLAMSIPDIDPDFPTEAWPAHWQELKHKGSMSFETRHRRKDGSIFPIEISANFVRFGDREYNIAFARNISARKQAENEGDAQVRYLKSMQLIADAVRCSLTSEQILDNVIGAIREIFASDRAWLFYPCDSDADFWEIPVESTLPAFPGVFALNQPLPMTAEARQVVQDALSATKAVVYCPSGSFGANLDQFAVRSQIVMAIRPKFGKPWMFGLHQCSHERAWSDEEQHLFQDIGDRLSDILSSTFLNRDLQKLSQAVQQAGEAVLMTDRNGVIEYVNPAFTSITGYAPEEVIGQTPAILKSSAQDPSFYKNLWDTITRGEVWHGTLIDRKKDGSFYPAMMSIAPITNDSGEISHYVSLQQDMTEYRKMEEQFLQSQKMEAIGTLVGGIAHDFNNMLAAIQGNVYLSRLHLKQQPEVADRLRNIELLGMRAAEMVQQLLTFARKDRMKMQQFSLNAFVSEAHKLAKTGIPENIELVYDICEEELMIDGDVTRLQQVLMNLGNNARDAVALADQPRIACRLSLFVVTKAFKKAYPDNKNKELALLTVSDNGSGIKPEYLQKIFEPFFTTKGVGEGTGLGLAMVYGAVQSHGGIIEVESECGKGTVFRIYLPLTKKGAHPAALQQEAAAIQGRGEVILLVDDEESMRDTTGEVLESLGYRVLSAGDGEQALQIFTAHRHEIRLVMTDIVMPKMGGLDLARCIRELDHDMPIIFATGYDKEQVVSAGKLLHHSIIFNKPFSFARLSQSIRNMIEPV